MRIDPALRALRSDPASQRAAQHALEKAKSDWLTDGEHTAIFENFGRYGGAAQLGDCPALTSLLMVPENARNFAGQLVDKMAAILAAEPLGQIPFRHQYSGMVAVLQLAVCGRADLSLVLYERSQSAGAVQSASFTDSERHEISLAGSADVRIVRRSGDGLTFEPAVQCPGHTLSLAGTGETKIVDHVAQRLVLLRLSRTAVAPRPSVEVRLPDGGLLHRASGDRRDSRHEMMLALLGRMERADAAPLMAEMSSAGSDHLRWQAVRECLALDSAQGYAALCTIAADARDPLASQAGALRAQLRETYPQLAGVEAALCPA